MSFPTILPAASDAAWRGCASACPAARQLAGTGTRTGDEGPWCGPPPRPAVAAAAASSPWGARVRGRGGEVPCKAALPSDRRAL